MNKFKPFTNIPSTPEDYLTYRIMSEIDKHNLQQAKFIKKMDKFLTENNEDKITEEND